MFSMCLFLVYHFSPSIHAILDSAFALNLREFNGLCGSFKTNLQILCHSSIERWCLCFIPSYLVGLVTSLYRQRAVGVMLYGILNWVGKDQAAFAWFFWDVSSRGNSHRVRRPSILRQPCWRARMYKLIDSLDVLTADTSVNS